MLQATVTLNLPGLQKMRAAVDQGTGPIKTMLAQWGVRYRSFVQLRFDRYSKGGGDWKPLSPATIARRRGGKPLTTVGGRRAFRGARIKFRPTKAAGPKLARIDKQIRKSVRKNKIHKASQQLERRINVKRERADRVFKERTTRAAKNKAAREKHNTRENARLEKRKVQRKKQLMIKARKVAILRDTGTMFAALNPTLTPAPGGMQEIRGLAVIVGYGGPARHPNAGVSVADLAKFHDRGMGVPRREIIVRPDAKTLNKMVEDAERALKKLADDVSK